MSREELIAKKERILKEVYKFKKTMKSNKLGSIPPQVFKNLKRLETIPTKNLQKWLEEEKHVSLNFNTLFAETPTTIFQFQILNLAFVAYMKSLYKTQVELNQLGEEHGNQASLE